MFFHKWIFTSYNNKLKFKLNELNKLMLKSLLSSEEFSLLYRFYFFQILKKFSKFTATSSYRRYCIFTGYTKSVYRSFKLSRHQCKRYASNGYLVGMRKSSF